uniref:T-cell receptor-associated transmembrane adapter 1 isoform X1 n=1 Tax=Pogona vitticeps TaxID=103695 RepID=UPI003BB8CF8E
MGDECIHCWIPLALITTVMIISLLKNISYCLKEKKQKGISVKCENYQEPCNSEFYSEECPVYDNLNRCHQDILNESCYEQMNAHAQPHTSITEAQQTAERQMCYASLDHSVKRKNKNLRKKKNPPPEVDDHHTRMSSVPSDTCIYLNSAQLNAENKLSEDATHDDPFSVFGFIPRTNDARF